jgi:hypothetical protein
MPSDLRWFTISKVLDWKCDFNLLALSPKAETFRVALVSRLFTTMSLTVEEAANGSEIASPT